MWAAANVTPSNSRVVRVVPMPSVVGSCVATSVSRAAISLLLYPWAMAFTTSASRSLRSAASGAMPAAGLVTAAAMAGSSAEPAASVLMS